MNHNISALADNLNIDRITIGRWAQRYAEFLSPGATPPKGKSRVLNATDVRVLYLISTLRNTGIDHDDIRVRLEELQENGWEGLPDIPDEWDAEEQTMPVTQAASRAYEMAQVAVLQSELKHVQQALEDSKQRQAELEQRIDELETEKGEVAEQRDAIESEKQQTLLELERTRAQIGELQAQIQAFNLAYGFGRDRPISIAVVIAITATAAAALIMIAIIVGSLLT